MHLGAILRVISVQWELMYELLPELSPSTQQQHLSWLTTGAAAELTGQEVPPSVGNFVSANCLSHFFFPWSCQEPRFQWMNPELERGVSGPFLRSMKPCLGVRNKSSVSRVQKGPPSHVPFLKTSSCARCLGAALLMGWTLTSSANPVRTSPR